MSEPIARLVLIGAPGAGKTRTGKRVARRLGIEFVDTDRRIVADHGPIADIFDAHGEAHFRRLERNAVAAALREPTVVALGGGAVLDESTRSDLGGLPVVQLTVSADAVAERIASGKRPLLRAGGIEAWQELVQRRQPIYDSISAVVFDTSSRPLDSIADDIVRWLEERDGGEHQ